MRETEARGASITVAAPTVFELHVGLASGNRPEEESARITEVLRSMPQLPLDAETAARAGRIYAEKKRKGQPIDAVDAMLAAAAQASGGKILTRNQKHFQSIEGVTPVPY